MEVEWRDIKDIEEFREYFEFSNFAVLVADIDEDGDIDGCDYTDIAFGIALMPKDTKRFCLIPEDETN